MHCKTDKVKTLGLAWGECFTLGTEPFEDSKYGDKIVSIEAQDDKWRIRTEMATTVDVDPSHVAFIEY